MLEYSKNSHKFLTSKVTSSNSLLCPTKKPKPKYIWFTISG